MAPPKSDTKHRVDAAAARMKRLRKQHLAAARKRAEELDLSDDDDSDGEQTREEDMEADLHEQDIDVNMYKDVDMGYELEPFNMKNERENGRFLENGRYIPNRAHADEAFLDGPIYIPKNKKPKTEEEKRKEEEDSKLPDEVELWKTVVDLLKPGETVSEAMSRYGGRKAVKKPKTKEKGPGSSQKKESTEPPQKDAKSLDALLGAANALMMQFACNQIFEMEREKASRFLQKIIARNEARDQARADVAQDRKSVFVVEDGSRPNQRQWEYKPLKEGGQVQGPFSSEAMLKWRAQGYFAGDYCSLIREKTGAKEAAKDADSNDDLLNDLLDSDDEDEDGNNNDNQSSKSSNEWVRSDKIAWPSTSFFVRKGLVQAGSKS